MTVVEMLMTYALYQSQGWKGYLATHEAYLIGFDGVPLVVATLVSSSRL